jgi:probable phosphoglycerate mutase
MKLNTIYFVRHGITNYNVEGRVQGEVDSELTSEGITAIKKIARAITSNAASSKPSKIITSPLLRAVQSSKIIAKELCIKHSADERLLELKRGIIEGKTKEEFTQEELKHGELFYNDPWNYRIPNGENLTDLKARVSSFLSDILTLGESLVIVSHGFTIRMMIYLLQNEEVNYDKIRAPHETIYELILRNGSLENIKTVNV